MNNETHLRTWNIYQSAWGPIGEPERRSLLARSVADGIIYTDPGSQVDSAEALVERIAKSQDRYPGAYFHNDDFLEHHDQGLFRWTMFDKDGQVFVTGTSFGCFGEDGRLTHATGFFKAPAAKRGD